MITEDLGFEVVGTAEHGLAAVDLAEALRPDLITLDVLMPVMNGLKALKHIMVRRPVATVMISALTQDDSHLAFDCLRCGAMDLVPKPTGDGPRAISGARRLIVERLRRAASLEAPPPQYCRLRPRSDSGNGRVSRGKGASLQRLLVMSGGRTGLAALLRLINSLPSDLNAAVLVSLDTTKEVVDSFARYLQRYTPLLVQSAWRDQQLRPNRVYLAAASSPWLVLDDDDDGCLLRGFDPPSGAKSQALHRALFVSVAENLGDRAAAVLLSGAPRGVLDGLEELSSAGAGCLAQPAAAALDGQVLVEAERRRLVHMAPDLSSLCEAVARELRATGR
jgi:two-component system chemotaxis response regulator CheB